MDMLLKNILVPMDFSLFSDYAFNAACKFAVRNSANLHLYHTVDIPDDWEDESAEVRYTDTINKKKAIESRDLLIKYQKEAQKNGIACEVHYSGGKFSKDVEEVLSKLKFDLVVMGAFGKTKKNAFVGSNTVKFIRKYSYPTLVLKSDLKSIDFKEVAFATSLNLEDKKAFLAFLSITKSIKCKKIHIVSIDTSGWFNNPTIVMTEALKDFKQLAKPYDVETHFYRDYSVSAGLRHFITDKNIEFIGISNQNKHPIKRIFQSSNVEALILESKIPVLSLDF